MYPVVSIGTKPPLVHVIEALNQECCFSATKSLPQQPWPAMKTRPPRLKPSFSVTLIPLSTKELLHEGMGSPHLRTRLSIPLHTKPEGRRRADQSPRFQGDDSARYNFGSLKNHSQGSNILLSHSLKS